MKPVIITAVLFQAWLTYASDADIPARDPPSVAGRLSRVMPRQAGRDCGRFTLDCQNAEGACNNACYHANCVRPANPTRITYIGPGNQAEANRNRYQSGCTAGNDGSVCRNYPFSQRFRDTQHRQLSANYQCDEWPPAASIQRDFQPGTIRNSLRCIPQGENASAGAKLGNFINDQGPNRGNRNPACAGRLNRGDYFTVDFNIANADQSKVGFCRTPLNCGSDGYQFALQTKPTQNGKISARYEPWGTDNHYRLENTIYPDVLQCSVVLTRTRDNDFSAILFNWRNVQVGPPTTASVTGPTGTFTVRGLPLALTIGKTGPMDSLITFRYGTAPGNEVAYIDWNSDTTGDGRGPATDAGNPLRYCKINKRNPAEQKTECWFACDER